MTVSTNKEVTQCEDVDSAHSNKQCNSLIKQSHTLKEGGEKTKVIDQLLIFLCEFEQL